MPLVRITLATGTTPEHRRGLSDAVHEALVETANVPKDDRFQVIEEVPAANLVWSPSYLGVTKSPANVFVQIVLNLGRSREIKTALYAAIAEKIHARTGLRQEEVLINLVEVPKENWSFGNGLLSYP
jgi:phenylpyruvate tautomerase PptA (4-oxalocrotonate tautomerase family)